MKIGLKKYIYIISFISALFLCSHHSYAQQKKNINLVYAGNWDINDQQIEGANIFTKDEEGQVRFEHEGIDIWCDKAILYRKENIVKAYGDIFVQQGDSLELKSEQLQYDGNTKIIVAKKNVTLQNPDMTLASDSLYFDRNLQEAYYETFSTIKDNENTLTSNKGRYYMTQKKYQFLSEVKIVNPEYTLTSEQLDYYTTNKHAYMYGPSTIVGKDYTIYCERGFYDTVKEEGYFIKKSQIDYDNRIINGDSLFFRKATEFASATNNIKITDTINESIIKGHYGEVFKAKDSAFVTKRAVAISLVEQDSVYVHGDRILITGKDDNRITRAYHNVKFFKTDMSGKCDSIHVHHKIGLMKMLRNPILWNGESQMTGDTIHVLSNVKTEKLDSLKVLNNAFIIQKDSLGDGYNQVKGKNLYGLFNNNKLDTVNVVKNTEVIYYVYDDEDEFIGINKTLSGSISMVLKENQIEDITFFINPDGNIYPDADLPKNARKLRGFIWRGDERILTKDGIFDEDDNNIVLPIIKGVNAPLDSNEPNYVPRKEVPDPKNTTQKVTPAAVTTEEN